MGNVTSVTTMTSVTTRRAFPSSIIDARPARRRSAVVARAASPTSRSGRLRGYLQNLAAARPADVAAPDDATMVDAWMSIIEAGKIKESAAAVATLDLRQGEAEAAAALRKAALRGTQVFFVKGHGITEEAADAVLEARSWFFARPDSYKLRFAATDLGQEHSGYEASAGGQQTLRVLRRNGRGGRLRWLDEENDQLLHSEMESEATLKLPVENFCDEASVLARGFRRVLALSLGFEADALKLFEEEAVAFRYGEGKGQRPVPTLGLFEIALLAPEDQVEVFRGREWVSAPPSPEGTVLLSLGRDLERLTSGKYGSAAFRAAGKGGRAVVLSCGD